MNGKWTVLTALAVLAVGAPLIHPKEALAADRHSPRCERMAARLIDFTKEGARDVLEVSAAGVDCAKSVVTVSIRLRNGTPVAAFAMPLAWLHEQINPARPLTPKKLKAYLKTYVSEVQLDIAASTLPPWDAAEPTPGFEQGHELTSPLSREDYVALRAAKPNVLCMRDVRETYVCYAWDAALKRAEIILRH
jgi:hypothetical protein